MGGDNSGRSDPGTIISSITPGGPADVNGCLKPGKMRSLCFLFLLCGCENRSFCTSLRSSSNFRSPVAGDRLLLVNDVNLQGLSHATAVGVLQNTADDVTLVVSQPKERLYKGEGGILVAVCVRFKELFRIYKEAGIEIPYSLDGKGLQRMFNALCDITKG